MGRSLSELTLEELWELFPVSLVPHNDKWAEYYAEMESFLQKMLLDCGIVRISHIGSTAVHGIWAKNIVDVLVEIDAAGDMEKAAKTAESNGFTRMSAGGNRISLNKGYTPRGFADKVYHLHIRYEGDHDELYFRDYMNEHLEAAKEYERLKFDLWMKYEHNRDAYTDGKGEFVKKWTREARRIYGRRY